MTKQDNKYLPENGVHKYSIDFRTDLS